MLLVLHVRGSVVAEKECGECEVAPHPDAAQILHCVACSEDGQAQRHAHACHHEDWEHEECLQGINVCSAKITQTAEH